MNQCSTVEEEFSENWSLVDQHNHGILENPLQMTNLILRNEVLT